MNKQELVSYIKNELSHDKNATIEYKINDVIYNVLFCAPNSTKGINISSIVAIPKTQNMNNQIALETNNLETDDIGSIIEQGTGTAYKLANLTDNLPCPIVIPLLPSIKDGPYFQQLSKECFNLDTNNPNYRMDEQVVNVINNAKDLIKEQTGQAVEDKIFLNGYSSSGVFAQRFLLIHPELVDTACIGGASGSISLPTNNLEYPIGIKDYKELFGKEFNEDEYLKIKQRYYVGELETIDKTNTRFDDNGNPAPIHDMSYFNRSVPKEVGRNQRQLLGTNMLNRADKTVSLLQGYGIDITHIAIPGRTHNNKSGHGVNELGDKIISNAYKECINAKNKDDESTFEK